MLRRLTVLIPCLTVLVLLSNSPQAAEPSSAPDVQLGKVRTWTDASGRFTIEAAMVAFAQRKVQLQRPDGSRLVVSVDQLSSSDRDYVAEEVARRRRAERKLEPKPQPGTEPPAAKPTPSESADWPGWRGPTRDGKSPDTGLLKSWPIPLSSEADSISAIRIGCLRERVARVTTSDTPGSAWPTREPRRVGRVGLERSA